MTAAEKAYQAAEAEIARVQAAGETGLTLSGDDFNALEVLPPEIVKLSRLEWLYLDNTQISDAGLAHLSGLQGLVTLWLNNTQISDAGLAHLSGLQGLGTLYLNNTRISDAGLAHLSGLQGLEMLTLNNTQISDAGLAHLSGLQGLRTLTLNNTQISHAGLAHLSGLQGLGSLWLNNTQISDAGLVHLSGLQRLATLFLNNTQISDAGLAHLSGLQGLGTLTLNNTQISDAGLAHLSGLQRLGTLYLNNTRISDAGLAHLSGLQGLEMLTLNNTQISDAGLAHLSGLQALRVLTLNNTQISDAGLIHLSGLQGLEGLWLNNTQISDAGLIHLSGLQGLEGLWLNNTQISDLRKLLHFTTVSEDAPTKLTSLFFTGIPALALDDKLRELSEIEDTHERTEQTLAYLAEVRDNWPPLPEAMENQEPQSDLGFRYGAIPNGQIGYDSLPSKVSATAQLQDLHELLHEDLATYLAAAPQDDLYDDLTCKVACYQTHLGETLASLSAMRVWKSGNDLRIALRAAERAEADQAPMANFPPLDSTRRTTLEALVSLHNTFASLHPEIAQLDNAQIDPAERHSAEWSKEIIAELVGAINGQKSMIVQEVRQDLKDLYTEVMEESRTSLRALNLEDESLQNLVKVMVAQALIETKQGGMTARLVGDVRGATVGAIVGPTLTTAMASISPEMAMNASQLVSMLEPIIQQAANGWYGRDSRLKNVLDWLMLHKKLNPDKDAPQEHE